MFDALLGDEVARKISTCCDAVELETHRHRDDMATAAKDFSLMIKAAVHRCLEDAVVDVQVAAFNKFVGLLCGKLDVRNVDGLVGLAQAIVWDDPSMADAFIQQGQNIVVLAKKTSSAPPQLHQLVVATKPTQVEPVFVVRMPRFPPHSSPNTVRSTKRVVSSTAIDPPPLPKKFRGSGIELPSLVTNAAAPTSTLAVTSSPQPAPPIRPLAHVPAPEFEVAPTSTLPSATSTRPNSPHAFLGDAPSTDITVEAVAAPDELIGVPDRAVALEPFVAAESAVEAAVAAHEVVMEAPSPAAPYPMTQRDAIERIGDHAGANYRPKASTTAPPPLPPANCPTCGSNVSSFSAMPQQTPEDEEAPPAIRPSVTSTSPKSPRAFLGHAPSTGISVEAVAAPDELIGVPGRAAASEPIVAAEAAVEVAVVAPSEAAPNPMTKRQAIELIAAQAGANHDADWYCARVLELYSFSVHPKYVKRILASLRSATPRI